MAPEPELDWAEEIDKWGHGIDLEEASEKDIETYIRVKIYENEKHDKMDKDLWDLFQEDFKDFTLAILSSIRTQYLQSLRNHLRGRGVYVAPNTKRTTIAQTLFDVIAEEEQHEWTDNEIQEVCTSMGTIKSMNLRYRIPQTPATTAMVPPRTQTQPTATATIPPGTQTQPTATATIPPRTQTQPTATATIPPRTQTQPTATATIPPRTQTQPIATATIPPRTQIPQTPVAFTLQQAAPTTTQQQYYPQTPAAFIPYQPAQQQYNPQQPAQQHTLLQATLQRPPDPGGGTASYKKEAVTVAKMYTDSQNIRRGLHPHTELLRRTRVL
jgi:hypothetical protein